MTEELAIHRTGRRGEEAATRLVVDRGWRIEGRNVRIEAGEIDILGTRDGPNDGETSGLVVEVKTTRSAGSDPVLRIDAAKKRRLFRIAGELVEKHGYAEVHVAIVAVHLGIDSQQLTWMDLEPF